MTNKQYLETLKMCGKINYIDEDKFDILSTNDFDLNSTVKFIGSLFDKNEEAYNQYSLILDNIALVLMNYKDTKLNISEYIEGYKRFLKTDLEIYSNDNRDIGYLKWLSDRIGPMSGIRALKTKRADRFEEFKGLDKDLSTNVVFIYNDNIEYIKAKDFDKIVKVLKRVLTKDDYDLVVLPKESLKWENKKDIYKRYIELFDDTSCGEYLDLIALLNDWECSVDISEGLKDYDIIKKSKWKAKDLLYFLDKLDFNIDFDDNNNVQGLSLLSQIVEKSDATREGIKNLEKILEIKYNYLWFEGVDTIEMMEQKTFKDMLEYASEKTGTDIDDLELVNEILIYKEKNPDKEFVLIGEDGKLVDMKSGKIGVKIKLSE